ncbi:MULTISPECIES: hypothetical protein [Yersinia]|uniref:hypothetical protein n=1 Tax=Yersinia TaxID=629 RepID=UPI000EB52C38|nr:hypothetical protein [Yersinia sp. IP36721]
MSYALALKTFFDHPDFKHKLRLISDMDITGWENWLQIEIALFLCRNEHIISWGREVRFENPEGQRIVPDFFLVNSDDTLSLIEVKMNKNKVACLTQTKNDRAKINLFGPSARLILSGIGGEAFISRTGLKNNSVIIKECLHVTAYQVTQDGNPTYRVQVS